MPLIVPATVYTVMDKPNKGLQSWSLQSHGERDNRQYRHYFQLVRSAMKKVKEGETE